MSQKLYPIKILQQIISQYGLPSESNIPFYKGMMHDLLFDQTRELNLLKITLEQGQVFRLIRESPTIPYKMLSQQMVNHLHETFGMDLNASQWAIDTWAEALGIHLTNTCIAEFSLESDLGEAPLSIQCKNNSKGDVSRYEWDFGDGEHSTENSPCHRYLVPGVYSVTLRAYRDSFYSEKILPNAVTVTYPELKGEIHSSVQEGEVPLVVQFTSHGQGMVQMFHWDFGDGEYSEEQNPKHLYRNEGKYEVLLTISDGNVSVLISLPNPIVVSPQRLHADFSVSQEDPGKSLLLKFANRSNGNATCFHWDFGDGIQSDEENPSHQYPEKYVITLTITDTQTGEIETISKEIITTLAPCKPDFGMDISEGTAPLTVQFVNQSDGNILMYDWDFGDGTGSSDKNPTHSYDNPGCYQVTLTITDGLNHSMQVKKSAVRIKPSDFHVDFSGQSLSGYAPLKSTFYSIFSHPDAKYHWNFGDGEESLEQNPIHVYKKPGIYSVTLKVSLFGFIEEHIKNNFVEIKPSLKPLRAVFSFDYSQGVVPMTVRFFDESEGSAISYQWDFGDGTTSSEQNPVHVYHKPGRYTVTLIISDGRDYSKSVKKFAIIVRPPNFYADFICEIKMGSVPLKTRFISKYDHPDATYHWIFGDGNESDEKNPHHEYKEPGVYTVTLYVTQDEFIEERKQKNLIEVKKK